MTFNKHAGDILRGQRPIFNEGERGNFDCVQGEIINITNQGILRDAPSILIDFLMFR